MFAQIYQMLLSLVIGVLCARYLGPDNYGVINYVASFVSFFNILCALGLEGIVVKDIVSDRQNEGMTLGSSIAMRLAAGVLSMASVCLIVWLLNPGDRVMVVVAFLQSIALLGNAFLALDSWYQSHLRSKVPAVVKCVAYTAMSGYKVFLLVAGKDVVWFAFSTSLDSMLIAAMLLVLYKRHSNRPLRVSLATMGGLIRRSYHLMISSIMAVVYSQMDRIMIGQILGMTQVGYYTAASTVCNMWTFIPKALSDSARPVIMGLKGSGDEALYMRRLGQLVCATFWMGFLFALAITALAGPLVDVLYGEGYTQAKAPLVIMIWSTVFSSLSYPRAIWMICEEKQRFNKQILAWGVAVNLVLNAALIPMHGIAGAAAATLATEVVCCLVAPCFYKETRPFVKCLVRSLLQRKH